MKNFAQSVLNAGMLLVLTRERRHISQPTFKIIITESEYVVGHELVPDQ